MPIVSISVCEDCGSSFIFSQEEMKLSAGMSPKNRKQNAPPRPIVKWEDWLLHLSTHCPECRFAQPPLQAVENLEALKEKSKDIPK